MPYPGDSYLESALKVAYDSLADGPVPNLYRASLLGGDLAARRMLAHDSRCRVLWGMVT